MKALSLTPPWPWIILHCGKRIENRERWSGCYYRGPIALHASRAPAGVVSGMRRMEAGRRFTATQHEALWSMLDTVRAAGATARDHGYYPGPVSFNDIAAQSGHIVGTANVVGIVREFPSGWRVIQDGTARDLTDVERSWWFGGFALVLDDVKPLKFVPCKGALGLWEVPVEVAERVALQL